jgi:hypothetical protein
LQVVASNDLHGLGLNDGPPATYVWTPPSLFPHLLPWLAVVGLLVLRPNRTAQAWWIWLPLAWVMGLEAGLRPVLRSAPSMQLEVMLQVFDSLAFGIVAVWLLAPRLQHRLRFRVFLKMLLTTVLMSVFAYAARQDWDAAELAVVYLAYLGVCVLASVSALSLAGWVCRHRYRPLTLSLWLLGCNVAVWLLLATPLFVMALLHVGIGSWPELFGGVLAFGAATFATMLPFLILAFANRFFRERLKALLGVAAG